MCFFYVYQFIVATFQNLANLNEKDAFMNEVIIILINFYLQNEVIKILGPDQEYEKNIFNKTKHFYFQFDK